ncbi:predicted protein [Uncinocarpus reesii 1704]|uniref:DUF2293 domain-containing protein n=1 Tax=Uncinocarpus reesii (strain UAMH 1704) TaxID=336963 RepID=C4JIS0_UNCRE|nr:uncharacterized protein UREG_02931 [Uncinocarpus reesii 1704]EEP78082.1 predicted protein [Uncinocarpus reesii 1704]
MSATRSAAARPQRALDSKSRRRRGQDSQRRQVRLHTQGPPPGYSFVPKGNVYITRNSRLHTHRSNQVVYTVQHSKTNRTLGICVPSDVHTRVLGLAAETAEARELAVAQKDTRDARHASDMLAREFPHMPALDMRAIVNHAFLKGSGRVGRSGTVSSEEKKAELAVEAHIRHVHTGYEGLLETGMQREDARELVWDQVKKVKRAWKEGVP